MGDGAVSEAGKGVIDLRRIVGMWLCKCSARQQNTVEHGQRNKHVLDVLTQPLERVRAGMHWGVASIARVMCTNFSLFHVLPCPLLCIHYYVQSPAWCLFRVFLYSPGGPKGRIFFSENTLATQ